MSFKNYAFYDKIIPGRVRTINGISFIPIVSVTVMGYGGCGLFICGSISPRGIVIVDGNGEVCLYQFSGEGNPSKLLESITLLYGEE